MPNWSQLSASITAQLGEDFQIREQQPVGGGCINETWRIRCHNGSEYFLKLNTSQDMFAAEAAGLAAIIATQTIRAPRPICYGTAQGQAFLLLEYLALSSRGNASLFGQQLAELHRCTQPNFGFSHNNYLGSTPQSNRLHTHWLEFWAQQRLIKQLQLLGKSRLQNLGEQLIAILPEFFITYQPQPALLHGDLWSGNFAYLKDGTPVIFDPACYYGDHECDIAMTELFGGFETSFYQSYRRHLPLDTGYNTRRELYNLYHILNHANLFGGGYVQQAEQMMKKLIR